MFNSKDVVELVIVLELLSISFKRVGITLYISEC